MVFSIIIPHKNVPDLLQRLLNSIPQREDTEVIIIDDHSDKEVVDFANFPGYGREDVRVIFLEESKGAGYARNKGIEQAKGKWLLFADADDYYTDNLSRLLDKYVDDESTDLVILNSCTFDENGCFMSHRINLYVDNYFKHRVYSEKVIRFGIWTPWSRMVNREFVLRNGITYEEIPVGNDVMFCLRCSQYAKKIKVEKCIVYNYFQPDGRSLTSSYYNNIKTMQMRVDKDFRVAKLYQEVGYLFKPSHTLGILLAKKNPLYDKEYIDSYKNYLRNYKYNYLKDIWYLFLKVIGRFLNII